MSIFHIYFQHEFTEQPQSPVSLEGRTRMEYESETIKEETNSESEIFERKAKSRIATSIVESSIVKTENDTEVSETKPALLSIKIEADATKSEAKAQLKAEPMETDCPSDVKPPIVPKAETKPSLKREHEVDDVKQENSHSFATSVKRKPLIRREPRSPEIEKGTVEIVDQNEPDTELEDLSSPIATMESDAELKQRVAEMRLEFGGSIAEIVSIASENERSEDDHRSPAYERCQDKKSDDNAWIDEFDVEAQMKKITGDDGNDYKEKIETSLERDKSMDGIEGLMESSKEDSESEDRDIEDPKYNEPLEKFDSSKEAVEERVFKEFETNRENKDTAAASSVDAVDSGVKSSASPEQQLAKMEVNKTASIASSEDTMFESVSSSMDVEQATEEPTKIFHSIPPLSERIRKKPESTGMTKKQLDLVEAAIIESTIELESCDVSENGEKKTELATALRELLEANIDDDAEPKLTNTTDLKESVNPPPIAERVEENSQERVNDTAEHGPANDKPPEDASTKDGEITPPEIRRLKDPRTVTPNDMPAPPPLKQDIPTPVKRKVRTVGMW